MTGLWGFEAGRNFEAHQEIFDRATLWAAEGHPVVAMDVNKNRSSDWC